MLFRSLCHCLFFILTFPKRCGNLFHGSAKRYRQSLTVLLCYIHMYRALADAKCLCGLPDSGIRINNIISNADGTLFDIILQRNTPHEYFLPLYELSLRGMTVIETKAKNHFALTAHMLCTNIAIPNPLLFLHQKKRQL